MSKRSRIVGLAEGTLRTGDTYKPTAEDMAGYFVDAGVLSTAQVAQVMKAIEKAVSGATRSIVMWKTPIEWCGIWATSILRRAGLNVKWRLGLGITNTGKGKEVERVVGQRGKGIQAGDIAYVVPKHHHFIVVDVLEAYDYVKTIEGNQIGHTIRRYYGRRTIGEIHTYYRIV